LSDTLVSSGSSENLDAEALETSHSTHKVSQSVQTEHIFQIFPGNCEVQYEVSDKAAAALANALLSNIGYLKPDEDAVTLPHPVQ
jgi:hypothetical protein